MLIGLTVLQSCKKHQSQVGAHLVEATGNKVFGKIDMDEFGKRMKSAISERSKTLKNPKFTDALYAANNYEPVLVEKFLPDSGLIRAANTIALAEDHGLSPEAFKLSKFKSLLQKTYDKAAVKDLDLAYQTIIDLELAASNSITTYSQAMEYGLVSPRRIYAQYYTKTKRPDSLSFKKPYQTTDLVAFLDSIQPKSADYKMLQQALKQNTLAPGHSAEESKRIIQVNLERLRWQNNPSEEKYVWVNIPEYQLHVIENGKAALTMKVCVGEGREQPAGQSLAEYDDDDLEKDRPFNRETPQLKSMIHSVQVNPVWNIPQSIATNEIATQAAKDRYYLSNNNIDVFYKGKLVEDPETIDWRAEDVGKTYAFKQRPGDDNSLGKIKFLFNNQSSVYLHDTPAKAAFNQTVRAVSHGCVRVEQPLELARALFGPGKKFDRISTGMASTDPRAEDISLPKQIPVYLSYFTCWRDPSGTLKFAKDVYGLDAVLYTHLFKG
ncbi:L,D-transpeptidase family protein [Pedobacter petrophilus]|uniref:L,D-transpeptidase family protein n=2 Tax=Pedobacter petrophilus TaxID=1908241 RepID=A0A7K0FW53_9SPHI|nr:L,D-transpeptidase family protein [Pedobacter petrophilus]